LDIRYFDDVQREANSFRGLLLLEINFKNFLKNGAKIVFEDLNSLFPRVDLQNQKVKVI